MIKRWSDDALADLLTQFRAGRRLCELSRENNICSARVRDLVDKAERLERRVPAALDGLSARVRNALMRAKIVTIDEVVAAMHDGRISDADGIGPVGREEIWRWLYRLSSNTSMNSLTQPTSPADIQTAQNLHKDT